jgi:hypothetical protein
MIDEMWVVWCFGVVLYEVVSSWIEIPSISGILVFAVDCFQALCQNIAILFAYCFTIPRVATFVPIGKALLRISSPIVKLMCTPIRFLQTVVETSTMISSLDNLLIGTIGAIVPVNICGMWGIISRDVSIAITVCLAILTVCIIVYVSLLGHVPTTSVPSYSTTIDIPVPIQKPKPKTKTKTKTLEPVHQRVYNLRNREIAITE